MANLASALITKLTVSNKLDSDDITAIRSLQIRERHISGREVIAPYGTRPDECCLIFEGVAVRSKTTAAGERQILSVHIPGEIPDLQSLHLVTMDHDLVTVTPSIFGFIPHEALKDLNRHRPNVAAALWRETLIDGAIFREWIVNVGRRPAAERMAHLLVEMHRRLKR